VNGSPVRAIDHSAAIEQRRDEIAPLIEAGSANKRARVRLRQSPILELADLAAGVVVASAEIFGRLAPTLGELARIGVPGRARLEQLANNVLELGGRTDVAEQVLMMIGEDLGDHPVRVAADHAVASVNRIVVAGAAVEAEQRFGALGIERPGARRIAAIVAADLVDRLRLAPAPGE
jgi:hypothetical protein